MRITSKIDRILGVCEEQREQVKIRAKHVETIQEVVEKYENNITAMEDEVQLCEQSSKLFKSISDDRNKVAKEKIEQVLNYALSEIPLEQSYRAELVEVSSKRSGKELTVVLTDIDTGYTRGLRNQTGTWVKQLVSFILNMIVIKFSGKSLILVLDEVFSGIEDEKMIQTFGKILTSLAENENFQIFMVEHGKELDYIEGLVNIPIGIRDYQTGTEIMDMA